MSLKKMQHVSLLLLIFASLLKIISSDSTLNSVTPPTCNSAGKFPAENCSEYYECEYSWFSWHTNLKKCPDGMNFDTSTGECASSGLVDCNPTTILTTTTIPTTFPATIPTDTSTTIATNTPTTIPTNIPTTIPTNISITIPTITTTVPSGGDSTEVTTPPCNQAIKYPARFENQYYECKYIWFDWRLTMVTCPTEEIYSDFVKKCVPSVTPKPGTLPNCTQAGKYAALEKNQYYECKYAWLHWKLYLNTCPLGEIFNQTLESCVSDPEVSNGCTEAAKYPGPQVNQYYECKYAWLKWKLYLVTCPQDQVYNQTQNDCVSVPEIPPVCIEAGKYPAVLENQYYECKYAFFKWKTYLVTCPLGNVFSQESKDCVPI